MKVWYDADNNGIFSPNNDVYLGQGTFGNTGNSRTAKITFNTPSKIVTSARGTSQHISLRYFVTVDMNSLATPETTRDSRSWPLPTPGMLPHRLQTRTRWSPIGLPYTSQFLHHHPVAAHRDDSADDPAVQRERRQPGRPRGSAGQRLADLDHGSSQHAGTADHRLRGDRLRSHVLRRQERQHAPVGSALPARDRGRRPRFGRRRRRVLHAGRPEHRLHDSFWWNCNGWSIVRWFSLKLSRFLPAGSIAGADTDVKRIRIWRDNGNGVLDRDPATGQIPIGTEILVGEKALGTGGDPGGTANIALNDPTNGNLGYLLVTSVQTTYWVTIDVDPTAQFLSTLLALKLSAANSVSVGALVTQREPADPYRGHGAVPDPDAGARDPPDHRHLVQIFMESLAPPTVHQADKVVPFARINLKTGSNTALWTNSARWI